MSKIAKSDKYHPAVRINAMLTIGDLNSVDSIQSAQNVPLANAMPVLLETVNDDKLIVPVRIAALVGINRHVTAGVNDPQTQNQIFSEMLKPSPAPTLLSSPISAGYGFANRPSIFLVCWVI